MSRTWKWILGIVLGLIILAGIGFAATYFFGFNHMAVRVGHPMMDDYGFGNRGLRQPMMGGRGFGGYGFWGLPFLFVGGFLRLIIPLAILAGVAYFAYQQGKKAGMRSLPSTPVSEPEPEKPE